MTTQEEVEQAAALVGSAVRKVRGVQSSRTGPVLVYRPERRAERLGRFYRKPFVFHDTGAQ